MAIGCAFVRVATGACWPKSWPCWRANRADTTSFHARIRGQQAGRYEAQLRRSDGDGARLSRRGSTVGPSVRLSQPRGRPAEDPLVGSRWLGDLLQAVGGRRLLFSQQQRRGPLGDERRRLAIGAPGDRSGQGETRQTLPAAGSCLIQQQNHFF